MAELKFPIQGPLELGEPDSTGKTPFKLRLARLDVPIPTTPYGGDTGKKYVMTTEGARRARATIVDMPLRLASTGRSHFEELTPLEKVVLARPYGVIKNAVINDGWLDVDGYLWTAENPVVTQYVAEHKEEFGGSWEIIPIGDQRVEGDTVYLTHFDFTGAALLERDSAAYQQLTQLLYAQQHSLMAKYTGPDDPTLPDYVKEKPEDIRRQWVARFNSAWDNYDPEKHGDSREAYAFRVANAILSSNLESLREPDYLKKGGDEDVQAAKWTREFINDLPDSAFAVIEPAYKRGETDNKDARHLPHHGPGVRNGRNWDHIDLDHLPNALARCNQIKPVTDSITTEELQRQAREHLLRHVRQAKKRGLMPHSRVLERWAAQGVVGRVLKVLGILKDSGVDLSTLDEDDWYTLIAEGVEETEKEDTMDEELIRENEQLKAENEELTASVQEKEATLKQVAELLADENVVEAIKKLQAQIAELEKQLAEKQKELEQKEIEAKIAAAKAEFERIKNKYDEADQPTIWGLLEKQARGEQLTVEETLLFAEKAKVPEPKKELPETTVKEPPATEEVIKKLFAEAEKHGETYEKQMEWLDRQLAGAQVAE